MQHFTIAPLQLNGNRGVNGPNAQPRVAKGQEQGDVLVVSKPSMAPSSVQEIFLSLRIAYQLLVQVKCELFFSLPPQKKRPNDSHVLLQLNGKYGVTVLSAQPLVAKDLE